MWETRAQEECLYTGPSEDEAVAKYNEAYHEALEGRYEGVLLTHDGATVASYVRDAWGAMD